MKVFNNNQTIKEMKLLARLLNQKEKFKKLNREIWQLKFLPVKSN